MLGSYDCSSRDYLERASALLNEPSHAQLFYAALELRCGIESRMQEYLEVWDHISKKKKKGWRIAEMGRNVEEAFRLGDKTVRWAIHDRVTHAPIACLYHTPVTAQLRKCGEELGNYLHVMKRHKEPKDPWWSRFSDLLKRTASLLQVANTGTLLGPPLRHSGTSRTDMNVEIPPGTDAQAILDLIVGRQLTVDVKYLSNLPRPLEEWAVVWPFVS